MIPHLFLCGLRLFPAVARPGPGGTGGTGREHGPRRASAAGEASGKSEPDPGGGMPQQQAKSGRTRKTVEL